MEFDYVVGFYSKAKGSVRALGGFSSMGSAKSYACMSDAPFLENGFRFIDSPEGIFIEGCDDHYTMKGGWFSLDSDKALVYDSQKNRVMELDRYMPQSDYLKFTQSNVFEAFQDKPHKNRKVTNEKHTGNTFGNRDSVIDKLSDNKKAIRAKAPDQKAKAEKQHDNAAR